MVEARGQDALSPAAGRHEAVDLAWPPIGRRGPIASLIPLGPAQARK